MRILLPFLISLIFIGCSVKNGAYTNDDKAKIDSLSYALISLSPKVDRYEANLLAKEMVLYPKELAKKYDLVYPPLLHNFLVNVGAREKGLCYHWVEDLWDRFETLKLKTIDLVWVVANKGEYNEHNALSAIPKGGDFRDGILLDSWRDSSSLFWIKTKNDKEYFWKRKITK